MIIEQRYLDEMIAHAQEEYDDEACGIAAGQGGRVVRLYRCTNSEHSPVRYNVAPQELLRIYREIEDQGWDFHIVYHSHTHSRAFPSPTDIRLAEPWPDTYFVIISLEEREAPYAKAFRIRDRQVTEEPIDAA